MKNQRKNKRKHPVCLKGALMVLLCAVMMVCLPAKEARADVTQINSTEQLSWGKSYSGKIENRVTQMYKYTIHLTESGHFGLVFNTSTVTAKIEIFDAAGNQLYEEYSAAGTTNHSLELLAGDYTLQVYRSGFEAPYLTFSFIPSFTASNETQSESCSTQNNDTGLATSYTVGQSYTGHLADNDNMDIYRLEVPKTGTIHVNLNSQLKSYSLDLVNNYGDVSYGQSEITSGAHQYSYFVPKGTYYLTIKQYSSQSTGTYTFRTSMSDMAGSKLKRVTNIRINAMRVKWTKAAGVSGYQIQIARDKNFKKGKLNFYVEDPSYTVQEIISLKRHKTYYVRVRNYVQLSNGKKYYSKWSNQKAVYIRK